MAEGARSAATMCMTPVGFVRSRIANPGLEAGSEGIERKQGNGDRKERAEKIAAQVSELVIDERLDGILEGIEAFSHILVLYWPHLIPEASRSLLQVHPMGRQDLPLKGIFSTCSPARPNPVLVTAVRLLSRVGNVLRVQGLEAVDGSPLIDIKPYTTHYYRPDGVEMAEWMREGLKEGNG